MKMKVTVLNCHPKIGPYFGLSLASGLLKIVALWILTVSIGWAQSPDVLLDFSPVMPPQAEKIKLVQPVVSWLVRPDAAQYCEQIKEQDGFAVWQEGCVYWSKAKPSCTIVTTAKTTHSQMGRLFLYCMDAGEPS
jgi:hypothetical protein